MRLGNFGDLRVLLHVVVSTDIKAERQLRPVERDTGLISEPGGINRHQSRKAIETSHLSAVQSRLSLRVSTDIKAERQLRLSAWVIEIHPIHVVSTDIKAERQLRLGFAFCCTARSNAAVSTDIKAERQLRHESLHEGERPRRNVSTDIKAERQLRRRQRGQPVRADDRYQPTSKPKGN